MSRERPKTILKENRLEQSLEVSAERQPAETFHKVKNFRELFILLNSRKLAGNYREAYEETARLARGFVDARDKSAWDSSDFKIKTKEKYPYLTEDFIEALARCVDNYNPPVNLPNTSLWGE